MRRKQIKYDCPFTYEERRQLYEQERSIPRVLRLATERAGWEKVPALSVGIRWMNEADIPIQSRKEGQQAAMQDRRRKCIGVRVNGQPCDKFPRRGYAYCPEHMAQRPLTEQEKEDQRRALLIADRIDQALQAGHEQQTPGHLPPGVAEAYMDALRARIADAPEIAAELATATLLPEEEATTRITNLVTWFEQQWQSAAAPLLPETEKKTHTPTHPRTGKKLCVQPPEWLRAPTAKPAYAAFIAIWRGEFLRVEGDDAIWAAHAETQVRIQCHSDIGFSPERAIEILLAKGPSVVQTFLSMAGLWIDQKSGRPYNEYLHIHVQDLMRYMGRVTSKASNGRVSGYNNDDVLAHGKDVFIIKNTVIPQSSGTIYENGKPKSIRYDWIDLAVIEGLSTQLPLPVYESDLEAIVEFNYHLGKEMYNWLCGDTPQYAYVSAKLLRYHPVRDKYKILFGFTLIYFDRVNRQSLRGAKRKISLPSLLDLAGLQIPDRNIDRFEEQIAAALQGLAKDNVIPDLEVKTPYATEMERAKVKARVRIQQASVTFPAMPALEEPAQPKSEETAALPA